MKNIPTKKIRRIEVDDDSGEDVVRVFLEVPKFQNFGQRLGELERKAREVEQTDPDPWEVAAADGKILTLTKAEMKKLQKRWDALDITDPEFGKKLVSIEQELNQHTVDLPGDLKREVKKKTTKGKVKKERFSKPKYDLERLRVELPEGMKWDKTAEARVDRVLADWPEIRPVVLKAVFKFYKKIHSTVRRMHDNPGAPFVLPEPTSPDVVADLFHVSAIYLQDDETTIGIGGSCTWDLEHFWGALIRKNKVVEVGGIDEAFNC
jgi:hypothetical protein